MLFSYFLDSMIIGLTLLPSVFTAASLEQQVLSLYMIYAHQWSFLERAREDYGSDAKFIKSERERNREQSEELRSFLEQNRAKRES